ncbi:solute carrier family 35 member G1-like isoform X1 [Convolutriloba macropyga]|uniref:solute carrier family 35 member G1-like isoform X1 n=2 Tax=Convolutriloba macropyga TaxID=536237 RepID=UPI003F51E610
MDAMNTVPKSKQCHGIFAALFNSLGCAVTGLLVKLSSVFNPFVLLMWSTCSSFLCLCPLVKRKNIVHIFRLATCIERLAVIGCVLSLPLCSICGYMSMVYMEFADSFAIQQSNVVICSLLAWILLREPLHWIDWTCLLVTTTGILLIARPKFLFGSQSESNQEYSDRWKGIVYALVSAMASSFFGVARRKIVDVDNLALLLLQTGFAFPVHTVLALTVTPDNLPPLFACGPALDKFYLAFSGILHGGCVMCNFALFKCLPAVYAMTLKALSSVFSYILQISFKMEPTISWLSLMGSMLIVASVIAKVVYLQCKIDSSAGQYEGTAEDEGGRDGRKYRNNADISHIEYTCFVK